MITSGGKHLEQRFIQIGFIDRRNIPKAEDEEVSHPVSPRFELICIDPKTAQLGRAAARAFGRVFPTLADHFKEFIPDDEERKAFGERAMKEFMSGKFCCYFKTYEHFP